MIHLLENAFDKQGQGYGNNFNYLPSNSTKIRKIKPSEIDDKVPFILPISCGGLHLYLDVQDGGLVGKKTFLYYLDEKIINLIRHHNGYILINYIHEGHVQHHNYKELHNELRKYQIPANKVFFISSNLNGKKQYNNFCNKMSSLTKQKLNIIEVNHMLESSVDIYKQVINKSYNRQIDKLLPYKQSFVTQDDLEFMKDTLREKYFLSYNRVIREYRLALISMIYDMNLNKKGIISLGAEKVDKEFGGVWPHKISEFIRNPKQNKIVSDALMKIKPLYPIDADGDVDANWIYKDGEKMSGVVGQWTNFSKQYKRVYFNIVTESSYYEDCIYMSEKTFKPISNLVPFIIVSNPFFLKKLRQLGYKTFHPWIDESYDEETDNDKRFFMILDEIKKLCEMTKKEIHDWYYDMKHILLHNQNHFSSYQKQDTNNIWNEIKKVIDG